MPFDARKFEEARLRDLEYRESLYRAQQLQNCADAMNAQQQALCGLQGLQAMGGLQGLQAMVRSSYEDAAKTAVAAQFAQQRTELLLLSPLT